VSVATASAAVRERLRAVEGSGLRTFVEDEPLVWARTSGTTIWDEDGRAYLDLYAGFAVAAVGHCHPRVTDAIARQAAVMTHCPSAAPSRLRAELSERLVELAPPGLERVLPAITGAQANELAIQLARAATGRRGVIAFAGTYVGRSAGTVRFAGKRTYRERLGLTADAQFLPYPDPYRSPWARGADPTAIVLGLLQDALGDPASGVDLPACIVVEPIQGNGGVVIPPDGFLRGLRRLADAAGALLVFDEIQCGFGRSGRTWACDHEGVVPDLMTVGKGIGGGLPLAAVLGRDEVMGTLEPDAVTSTFLTGALAAAAGLATLDVFAEADLGARSARLGAALLERLRAGLHDAPHVGEVRGRGLFAGIELVRGRGDATPAPERAAATIAALRERGVIVGKSGRFGNVVKLAPALVIDEAELGRGIDAILEVVGG
jgi:4-aminobutyrate aminotransferase-like enzyme